MQGRTQRTATHGRERGTGSRALGRLGCALRVMSRRGVGLLLLPVYLACQPATPVAELPTGPLLAGDAAAFAQILDALQRLESTPLAREAARAREAVRGCSEFSATAGPGGELFEASACSPAGGLSPAISALRADAALVFVWPLGAAESEHDAPSGAAPRLAGRVYLEADGSIRVDAQLDRTPDSGLWRWLMPAAEPAGAARLATRDALVRGRFRPRDGLDLASLVPAGSQADHMFRLKSELFAGAALGAAWEFSIYMPAKGSSMPPMAAALDVRDQTLALRGVRAFVAELEATWPLQSREVEWSGGVPGACFDELRIMPEFAPCYAVTDRSLVFAWNPSSLERAIAAGDPGEEPQPSRLVANLARFPQADERLQRASRNAVDAHATPASALAPGAAPSAEALAYPFAGLELEARPAGDSIAFRVRLTREETP